MESTPSSKPEQLPAVLEWRKIHCRHSYLMVARQQLGQKTTDAHKNVLSNITSMTKILPLKVVQKLMILLCS